jgi:hypothetical protein
VVAVTLAGAPSPAGVIARTENEYVTPGLNPERVAACTSAATINVIVPGTLLADDITLIKPAPAPGTASIWYPVMSPSPELVGGDHVTVASVSVTVTCIPSGGVA